MRLSAHPPSTPAAKPCRQRQAGFTLAEVLAALMFMAIVIPVAIEGIRVASQAGQVGLRKATATRVAERVLAEWLVSSRTQSAQQRGTIREESLDYRWSIRTEPWNQDTMRLATAEVLFSVQGRDYDVRVATLIDNGSP